MVCGVVTFEIENRGNGRLADSGVVFGVVTSIINVSKGGNKGDGR